MSCRCGDPGCTLPASPAGRQARAEVIGLNGDHLRFDCPGCDSAHVITVAPHRNPWDWNGDTVRPTISPSILVQGGEDDIRCHSFVREGRIEYLHDCTHSLAGQTTYLPPIKPGA